MRFTITMKDPDAPYDCINNAVRADVGKVPGLSEDEREAVIESRQETVRQFCGTWFKYGECLTVEVDTEAQTCTVLPAR